MNTVVARLLQPTWLVVGIALLSLLALALLILVGGVVDEGVQLVGPFRWEPSKHIA